MSYGYVNPLDEHEGEDRCVHGSFWCRCPKHIDTTNNEWLRMYKKKPPDEPGGFRTTVHKTMVDIYKIIIPS